MKKNTTTPQRRNFLKNLGLSTLPVLLPAASMASELTWDTSNQQQVPVNFIFDGLWFSPQAYLDKLQAINQKQAIAPDYYGNGGATQKLETAFAKITGKEKAIFLPTGTMANQLVIKLLNGNNTKVLVPENSHVFRDEADAAQEVHGKRLVPVGKGKPFFELQDLKQTIRYYNEGEVFRSGIGTVVIECPVRRADGAAIPFNTLKAITNYCREKGYKTHLDGARIHLASAYTGVSVAKYASLFDTVYISLYKYLNASSGAILCGKAEVIDQLTHQIKVYGGTAFQTWNATAMALHYLEGIEDRWKKVKVNAAQVMSSLNKLEGVQINKLTNGTNIYHLKLDKTIDLKVLANTLFKGHNIWLGRANKEGIVKFTINESLLQRTPQKIVDAWKQALGKAKK
ncbi:MAG TPA: threonine aldolase [Microscillaceae bacterium]|nr:threonine aldolase [Microscillaceae bacterium]